MSQGKQEAEQAGREPVLLAEPRGGVPEVIDTLEGYEDACRRLKAATGPLAADAERAYAYRYSHRDWLIQFKRGDSGIILLDPVALDEAGADWNLFNDAVGDAAYILHDSLQDLPGFVDLGLDPKNLFDTEIAARLLGMRRYGLAAVTEHYLGLTLAKEHSAADWSYRPLPRDWRNYAALDVEVLIELEDAMWKDLKAQGKEEWARQEFAYTLARGKKPRRPSPDPWMNISHFTTLGQDRRGQAVAKALWEERDGLAREWDIEPTLLLSDAAIIEAARKKPHNAAQFRAIRSLNTRVVRHMGNEQDKMFQRYAPIQRRIKPSRWKRVIQEALDLPRSQWPHQVQGKEHGHGNAPKSMGYWAKHHPDRLERLRRVRRVVGLIAQRTKTAEPMVIKPQILKNLCWHDDFEGFDVTGFMREQGARQWQIDLVAESVTRVIM